MREHPKVRKIVAANLSRIIEEKDAAIGKLAEQAGITRQTLNNVMGGKTGTKIETLAHLAESLGVPLAELVVERAEEILRVPS